MEDKIDVLADRMQDVMDTVSKMQARLEWVCANVTQKKHLLLTTQHLSKAHATTLVHVETVGSTLSALIASDISAEDEVRGFVWACGRAACCRALLLHACGARSPPPPPSPQPRK